MNVCRRCGIEVRQSAYGWGHTANPANGHHYVRLARPSTVAPSGAARARVSETVDSAATS